MKNEFALYLLVLFAIIIFAGLVIYSLESTARIGYTTTIGGNKTTTNFNQLTITASGTVSNKSTQASLYVIVNGTGANSQLAVQNISATLNKFNSTILKFVNGNLSRVSTTYFNTYKAYNKSAYTSTEGLSIVLPNINNVSGAIGALSNITNVYVVGATPQLSDAQTSAMRIEALSLAMSNATAQAHALIGPNDTIYATNISVNNYRIFPYGYAIGASSPGAAGGGNSAAPEPSINSTIPTQFYGGTNQVTETVTVVFNYGPK
jgi:uncharacterized protein YggE